MKMEPLCLQGDQKVHNSLSIHNPNLQDPFHKLIQASIPQQNQSEDLIRLHYLFQGLEYENARLFHPRLGLRYPRPSTCKVSPLYFLQLDSLHSQHNNYLNWIQETQLQDAGTSLPSANQSFLRALLGKYRLYHLGQGQQGLLLLANQVTE